MKKYLFSIYFLMMAILSFATLFSVYPKSPQLSDAQLYQVRVNNVQYISSHENLWSLERKAEWVDKSIRKIKSSETYHSVYYGMGYFLSLIFLVIGFLSFLNNKNKTHTSKDSTKQWLSRLDY